MSDYGTAELRDAKVIPDVLHEGTKLAHQLTVKWPTATLDNSGKDLDREATQPEPTLFLTPEVPKDRDDYVIIMTDPDLMSNNDLTFGQVRHWLAVNVPIRDKRELRVISPSSDVSPYIGPAPLPNYVSRRPHRYVFIVAQPRGGSGGNPTKVKVTNEDLQELQKEYPTFGGQQELQDLKDRWGFNAQRFMDMKGLEPVAVAYMLVGGTLKSAVDNLGMTVTAAAHKVPDPLF
ncbi:hypothetical protein H2200_011268 [Cladophialophora chaetospira]|uniref:PEBP-like protein n=1 Tax=Cladophialophora chaetospira TaxID=386627 RepID=A0AA39CDQ7_9EURO|nr:hypothetical protein H2200_011268 [Cladophialophora chaetospira]